MIPILAAHARCIARSGLRALGAPGQRALLRPDPRVQAARGTRESSATMELGKAHKYQAYSYCDKSARSLEFARAAGTDRQVVTGSIDQPVFNIDVLVALLRQENAKDICVIKLPVEIKYTDYFIIVSGTSARHLQAMAQYAVKVHKHLKNEQNAHVHIEGKETDDWKCIDFGNIVVHFMLPESRAVYELEKLWTLCSHDDQLVKIPPEILPTDFIYGPTDDIDQTKV
ncbi:mitochondrial assembly of ribosomal large subunit protein 1 [Heterodontus francisci]|uniref:mitochondrial assembly of ribosomal large subunit protein 1 n=1 Tax=Heterodontus francisci TaxID=7792 RepID=UPI00355C48DA